ncbi:hypothetical protein D9M68_833180 [compost metagenome]
MRHGATRETRARAARHHRHIQRVADLEHRGHLVFGLGQHHHQRALAVGGEAVAFVGHGVFGLPEQRVGGYHGLQCTHHLGLARGALELGGLGGGGGCVHGGFGMDCKVAGSV